jgi:S-adenosylmethionine uptake transporter
MSEACTAAPFEYVAISLAVIWGFLVWGDLPDAVSWFCIFMILAAGIFLTRREVR